MTTPVHVKGKAKKATWIDRVRNFNLELPEKAITCDGRNVILPINDDLPDWCRSRRTQRYFFARRDDKAGERH